jgi:isoquinoline 1-oxidoreductase beta subunit
MPATDATIGVRTLRQIMEAAEKQAAPFATNRRGFLKLTGVSGLALALDLRSGSQALADDVFQAPPNAYVIIAPDNTITIMATNPEIGQGIKTAFAMIIAEEMDADWSKVNAIQAPISPKVYGNQFAGGSNSISLNYPVMRIAGATMRAMLVSAAAKQWNVPTAECSTANSMVLHAGSGRKLTYGALSAQASALPIPDAAGLKFKDRKDYKLVGKRITGVDNAKIVTGQGLFGIDVRVPGMVYANFTKCPAVGGKVASANLDHIKTLPGVKDAFVVEGTGKQDEVMPGVAVIATTTWNAFNAKKALQINWDESAASKDSSSVASAKAAELAKGPGNIVAANVGDVDAAFAGAAKIVEAYYEYPFLCHAPLEPQNTTAWFHDGTMEIWSPSQVPHDGLLQVAAMLKLEQEKVIVHQTRVGGAFGRRGVNDYMCEAAAIAMRVNAPVKLMWMREDDMAHDFHRAAGFHGLKGAVDAQGKLSAWQNHFITFTQDGKKSVIGGNLAPRGYPINLLTNARITQSMLPLQVPCGYWRAPGANGTAFPIESFINELAHAAGQDEVGFRIALLNGAQGLKPGGPGLDPARAVAVIKLAAEKAGWGKSLPKGTGMGIAFNFGNAAHIAEIAEVSVDANKKLTIHKVTVAADIGQVINVSGAENQIQGSVLDGISTMFGLQIDIENGRVQQANYNTYPLLRMRSAPLVEVHFIESEYRPTGIGEPALPPIAPAVTQAIFAATGTRIRKLPLSKSGYTI